MATSTAGTLGSAIDTFAKQIRGDVIQPNSADYDVARRVYNQMIDRRPAAIIGC